MNFLAVTKVGDRLQFGDTKDIQTVPALGSLARLADGKYLAGFRPNHLHLTERPGDNLTFTATLAVTEITGSETFMHLDHYGARWVGLLHGVRQLEIGAPHKIYLDPAHVYIFGEDGRLIAPAAYAMAA